MNLSKLKGWLWLLVALVWGVAYGVLTLGQREPLTGWLPTTHFVFSSVQGLLAGLATYCAVNMRWRVVASILVFLALFFGVPLPSMAGLTLRIENQSRNEKLVVVVRTDRLHCHLDCNLAPNTNFTYKTAPGDWPSSAGLAFRSGTNQITATILELRRKKVVLADEGIRFEDFTPHKSDPVINSVAP